jgi:hypothetical protein
MATRLYLQFGATPPVTPTSWAPGWNTTTNGSTSTCNTVRQNSTLSDKTVTYNTTPTIAHEASARLVSSKPLLGQTFTGEVSGVIRCLQNNAGNNSTVALAIRSIKPDGTHGHHILSVSASDNTAVSPPEIGTGASTRRFQDVSETFRIPISGITVATGDYLLLEIGFRKNNATASRTVTLRYGDNGASDFGYSDAASTDLNPWIEFSHNIQFLQSGSGVFYNDTILNENAKLNIRSNSGFVSDSVVNNNPGMTIGGTVVTDATTQSFVTGNAFVLYSATGQFYSESDLRSVAGLTIKNLTEIYGESEVLNNAAQIIRSNPRLIVESILIENNTIIAAVINLPEGNSGMFQSSTIRGNSEVF